MWSALQNVGALVDQGISQATTFLEELDNGPEEDEDEGEVGEGEERSADAPSECVGDVDLHTPLRGKAAGDGEWEEGSHAAQNQRREQRELETQLTLLEEQLREEKEARGKAEDELTHVREAAVSPKVREENLRVIALLKQELVDVERFNSVRLEDARSDLESMAAEAEALRREVDDVVARCDERLAQREAEFEQELKRLAHAYEHEALRPEALEEAIAETDTLRAALDAVAAQLIEARSDLESRTSEADAARVDLELATEQALLREAEFEEELGRLVQEDAQRLVAVKMSLQSALSGLADDASLVDAQRLAVLETAEARSRADAEHLSAQLLARSVEGASLERVIDDLRAQVHGLGESNEELRALLYAERDKHEGLSAASFLRRESECGYCVQFREQLQQKQSEMEGITREVRAEAAVEIAELKDELYELTARCRADGEAAEEGRVREARLREEVAAAESELCALRASGGDVEGALADALERADRPASRRVDMEGSSVVAEDGGALEARQIEGLEQAEGLQREQDVVAEAQRLMAETAERALSLEWALQSASRRSAELELIGEALGAEVAELRATLQESRQCSADAAARQVELQTELEALRSLSRELEGQLRDDLRTKDVVVAALEHKLEAAAARLASERELLEGELQGRIDANASLSEELSAARDEARTLEEALVESRSASEALAEEMGRGLDETAAAASSLSEQLSAALRECGACEAALSAATERCASLEASFIETSQSAASRNGEFSSRLARAEEAESSLALIESKKKRDLEFLRKQNESISALQRRMEETCAMHAEKEAELCLRLEEASVSSIESLKLVEHLQEALDASEQEAQALRTRVADVAVAAADEELVIDSAGPVGLVASEVLRMQELLSTSEGLVREFEWRVAGLERDRVVDEAAHATRLEEVARQAQMKTAALEDERARLEAELLTYQKSLSDANSESVEKDWNAYRNSSANVFSDVEMGGNSDEGGQKKDGLGIPWGTRADRTRIAGIAVLYLAVIHSLLLYNWAYCQRLSR